MSFGGNKTPVYCYMKVYIRIIYGLFNASGKVPVNFLADDFMQMLAICFIVVGVNDFQEGSNL